MNLRLSLLPEYREHPAQIIDELYRQLEIETAAAQRAETRRLRANLGEYASIAVYDHALRVDMLCNTLSRLTGICYETIARTADANARVQQEGN